VTIEAKASKLNPRPVVFDARPEPRIFGLGWYSRKRTGLKDPISDTITKPQLHSHAHFATDMIIIMAAHCRHHDAVVYPAYSSTTLITTLTSLTNLLN